MTTCAPSSANRRTVARPMPLQPPVTTAVRPSSRPVPAIEWDPLFLSVERDRGLLSPSPRLRRRARPIAADEDVLELGEGVERVRAELAADAGLLEAAERRGVAHRRVRVDAEVAGVDTTRDADRPRRRRGSRSSRTARTPCRSPSRSRRPRRRTAAPPRPARTPPRARPGPARSAGSTTVGGYQKPGPVRRAAAERHVHRVTLDVRRHGLPLVRADQRAHLGVVVARRLDLDPCTAGSSSSRNRSWTRALDQDAAARAAVLAGVVEDAVRRGRGRLLEVGVGEHDVGALAAELERDPLDLVGGSPRMIRLPTSVEPVKQILRTAGWRDEPLARPPSPCPRSP